MLREEGIIFRIKRVADTFSFQSHLKGVDLVAAIFSFIEERVCNGGCVGDLRLDFNFKPEVKSTTF